MTPPEHEGSSRPDSPKRSAASFVPNPRRSIFYRIVRGLLRFLLRIMFRPILEGPGVIPAEGPVIIAPVHRSNIDFSLAILLTDRKMFFIAKDSLWKASIFGRFVEAMGAFPVNRGTADRSALNHAEAVLASGNALVLFPEGTRQDGPLVADILEGAAFLSARTGAPIVPVGIGGSARAMPKGASFPRPTRIRLYLGEPIESPARTDGGRVPRSVIHETTLALRLQIQECFDRASA